MTEDQLDEAMLIPEAFVSLDSLLAKLYLYFAGRAATHDAHLLVFHLRHLFSCSDILYCTLLPGLAAITQSAEQKASLSYHIWSQLKEIECSLERTEPVCHLLSNVIVQLLDAINRTCSVPNWQAQTAESRETNHLYEQFCSHKVEQEQWQHLFAQLTAHLETWQNGLRCSFSTQFATLAIATLPLGLMDTTFHQIVQTTKIIFSDILPGLQTFPADDDEAMATLLFDLAQRIDQIVLSLTVLLDPLRLLMKHYAPGAEIY